MPESWSTSPSPHVVPHYRAPGWVAEGDLAGATASGLVDVDPFTLRHRRYPSVWSLGDVADLGIKSSGGALRTADSAAVESSAVDTGATEHRAAYWAWFRAAGVDDELAEALYAVEWDVALNPFAEDVGDLLQGLRAAGVRVGVLSDIHVDLRPVFGAQRLPDGRHVVGRRHRRVGAVVRGGGRQTRPLDLRDRPATAGVAGAAGAHGR